MSRHRDIVWLVARGKINDYPQLGNWSLAVTAHDADPRRPDPLKRLFLPFDRNAKGREPQTAARVLQTSTFTLHHLHCGHSRIAIKAIGVGYQRPELFGRRIEIEFPAVMKLAVGHIAFVRLRHATECATT